MEKGDRLAHFEITGEIGAGGMGVVHRARDTRLGRDVALKALPPEFSEDPERLALFRREAKVLASLNHPNIASIYGLEEADRRSFLVMELVEGEDLAERLARGALPVDEAIATAVQIAEGLEEAHEQGIIHRDLKPANIKMTPEGKVKILDFGLARALAGKETGESDLSLSPTITAMTKEGVILGTAAYMSPEQARGKSVDRRADIWAFGVVLFEMLTGRRLFSGETVSDTLANVLVKEPPWDSLPNDLPPRVERVLRRCLERDPRQRLRDIGEARVRLQEPHGISGDDAADGAAPRRRPLWLDVLPWAVAAASVAALVLIAAFGAGKRRGVELLQVTYPVPHGTVFHANSFSPALPAISPDGTRIAFGADDEESGTTRLYIRSLNAGSAYALDGTEGAQYPFWSPDGQWIGFFVQERGLLKIPVNGGPALVLCDAEDVKGGTWNRDGTILFAPSFDKPIHRISAGGGESTPVTKLEGDEDVNSHRHPRFLPDGRHFLYLARKQAVNTSSVVRLASLDGEPEKDLLSNTTAAEYADGRLLFVRDGVLLAQPLDVTSGSLTGEPRPVAQDALSLGTATGAAAFSVSANGALTYLVSHGQTTARLDWRDRKGNITGRLGDEAAYSSVALSPDGSHAAVTLRESSEKGEDIWIYEIERNLRTRFTLDDTDDWNPMWEQDGKAILFHSSRDDTFAVYRKEIGGTGEVTRIMTLPNQRFGYGGISPDGHWLASSIPADSTGADPWVTDLTGKEEPRRLRRTPFNDGAGGFSPDGKWLILWSVESGTFETCVAPFPSLAPVRQVSTTSGTFAFWRGDGTEIFYQEQGGAVMAAPISFPDGKARIGEPETLFDFRPPSPDGVLWSPAPDGQSFLTIDSDVSATPSYGVIVLGWPKLLERP